MKRYLAFAMMLLALPMVHARQKNKAPEPSPLDRYVQGALQRQTAAAPTKADPGSTWSPVSGYADLAADLRAAHVDDMITVLVLEKASAISQGQTKTARQSSVTASIGGLAGKTRATGPWANLANASSNTQLSGQGVTSRDSSLTTTLSARVTDVLPNGYLVVEGTKQIVVNSEHQVVSIRGVVRPVDLTPNNVVRSDQIAEMEVRIDGKGVVNDSIRRPFFLYRLLLGLLPF